jgi:hypothetical protein
MYYTSGSLSVQVEDDSGNQSNIGTTLSASNNVWYNGAITVDNVQSASPVIAVFLNGGGKASTTGSITANNWNHFSNAIKVLLAADSAFGAAEYFGGALADAAAWTVVLSDFEIAALGAGARPYRIRPGSLVGYWPLQGKASPEPDFSNNANNGTVTGTTTTVFDPPFMQMTPRWPQVNPVSIPPVFTLMPQIVT